MRRRTFLSGLAVGIVLATPALSNEIVDSIVQQLKGLGFSNIVQQRTLLGRIRITATRWDGSREIIVNPNSGEILRDLWSPKSGNSGKVTIIDDKKSGKRNADDDDDDDDDDDNDDDDEDDDNSGKGGGNSGSNSGSGGGGDDDDD
jgi:hypothetical protein